MNAVSVAVLCIVALCAIPFSLRVRRIVRKRAAIRRVLDAGFQNGYVTVNEVRTYDPGSGWLQYQESRKQNARADGFERAVVLASIAILAIFALAARCF